MRSHRRSPSSFTTLHLIFFCVYFLVLTSMSSNMINGSISPTNRLPRHASGESNSNNSSKGFFKDDKTKIIIDKPRAKSKKGLNNGNSSNPVSTDASNSDKDQGSSSSSSSANNKSKQEANRMENKNEFVEKGDEKRITKAILTSKGSFSSLFDQPLPSIKDEKEDIARASNLSSTFFTNNNNSNNNNKAGRISDLTFNNVNTNNRLGYSSQNNNSNNVGVRTSNLETYEFQTGSNSSKVTNSRSSMLGDIPIADIASRLSDLSKKDISLLQKKQSLQTMSIGAPTSTLSTPATSPKSINSNTAPFELGSRNKYSSDRDILKNQYETSTNVIDEFDEDDDSYVGRSGNQPNVDHSSLGLFILASEERKAFEDKNDDESQTTKSSQLSNIGHRFSQRLSRANLGKFMSNRSDTSSTNQNDPSPSLKKESTLNDPVKPSSNEDELEDREVYSQSSNRISIATFDSVYPTREKNEHFDVVNPAGASSHEYKDELNNSTSQSNTNQTNGLRKSNSTQSLKEKLNPYLGTLDQNFFIERRNTRTSQKSSMQLGRRSLRATQSEHIQPSEGSDPKRLSTANQNKRVSSSYDSQASQDDRVKDKTRITNHHERSKSEEPPEIRFFERKPSSRESKKLQKSKDTEDNKVSTNSKSDSIDPNSRPPSIFSKRNDITKAQKRDSGSIESDDKPVEGKKSSIFSSIFNRLRTRTVSLSQKMELEFVPHEQKPTVSPEMQKRIDQLIVWLKERDPNLVPDIDDHCTKLLMKYEMENVCRALFKRYKALPPGWYVYMPENTRGSRKSSMKDNVDIALVESTPPNPTTSSHNHSSSNTSGNMSSIVQLEKLREQQEKQRKKSSTTSKPISPRGSVKPASTKKI